MISFSSREALFLGTTTAANDFNPFRVGQSDNRQFLDTGILVKHFFDLAGSHVFPAGLDHVFPTVDHVQITVAVNKASQIAAMEPAELEGFFVFPDR